MWFLQLLVTVIIIIGCNAIRHHNLHLSRRKVGGQDADIADFPYQYKYTAFCGGSIISVEWVLTAAHCTEQIRYATNFQRYRVRVGTNLELEGGHLHEISACVIHPEYRGYENSYNCDISLLKVVKPFEFGPTIQPIVLSKNPLATGSIVGVTGWGKTTGDGDRASKLQKVQVTVLPQWDCELTYRDENITENMFCSAQEGHGTCSGDSGSPVMFDGKQIGIVSFTRKCTQPVYVNVYSFYAWIHKYTGV